ncbi:signal transducing adapter molecule 1 [Sitophilus oryzae]|uniref:Signal transducing adapter molecule 1 n=1 Tax=Sitophilus oryzae TaxID=7048 RepID=A0A6J2YMY6_SITOR|nr:signal transducing adapter molecule 1 [Sitophilus oryzae]
MGLFGNATDATIQDEVERATSDKLVEDDWGLIMNICDKAGKSSEDARTWLRAIVKRLYNSDPHVGTKAVTVLDACVKNSGKTFHIELASREFENDFTKLMSKGHSHVAKRLRESLKKWAENEFKSDGQLTLIPSLYNKLKTTYDFSSSDTPVKRATAKSNDPDVVESQEEEAQILKAIELSLKETSGSPRNTSTASSSLYPSVNIPTASSNVNSTAPGKEPKKVRALYDFEAAEDNELTFGSGEIIVVIDDSDPNWWKGSNQRGEGLFPANFVTADLSVEPEKFLIDKTKKMVQFKDEVKVLDKEPPQDIEVNEDKIDRLLHLLHEADPTNPETDTDELLSLEREVNAMGPLIDSELERVDRKHAQLTQLSADLVEALSLYHTLMREPQLPSMAKQGYEPTYGYGPASVGSMYNGMPMGMQQHHQPPQSIGYQIPGPPGLPSAVQERIPYVPNMQQYGIHQQHPMHSNMPHNPQGHMMPMQPPPGMHALPGPGMPGGMPQPNYQPMHEDRRMEVQVPLPQFQQNMPPNYGHPSLSQSTFPNTGPVQNGPAHSNQQPHFVSSSTHIMQ